MATGPGKTTHHFLGLAYILRSTCSHTTRGDYTHDTTALPTSIHVRPARPLQQTITLFCGIPAPPSLQCCSLTSLQSPCRPQLP